MKHLLFFLLAFPFLASAQILEKQFVATVQFNGFTQINDSLYRGDLIEFRDVLVEGYQPSGVDSGFICLDGTGRAYRVEVVNSFDYSSLNVDLIELDDYDEIPIGVGIVAERYGSTYQIPNGLVNSIGISSVLQAKILNHNTKIAATTVQPPDTLYLKEASGVTAISDGDTIDVSPYLFKSDTAAMLSKYIERGDTASMLLNYPSTAGYGIVDGGKTWRADTSAPSGLATRLFVKTLPTSILTGQVAYSNGSNLVGSANHFWDNSNVRLGIGTNAPSFPLDVVGNTNGTFYARVYNPNAGTAVAAGYIAATESGTGNQAGMGKVGYGYTTYKTLVARDMFIYNGITAGDISILNDFPTGRIKFSTNASGTAQMTLAATGNLLLGTTTDVPTSILTARSTTKSSSPFPFHTTAESNAITGVNGNFEYITDGLGPGFSWYNGTRKAYGLESTFNRGTATRVPFFDANGQVTDDADNYYNSTTNQLNVGIFAADPANTHTFQFTKGAGVIHSIGPTYLAPNIGNGLSIRRGSTEFMRLMENSTLLLTSSIDNVTLRNSHTWTWTSAAEMLFGLEGGGSAFNGTFSFFTRQTNSASNLLRFGASSSNYADIRTSMTYSPNTSTIEFRNMSGGVIGERARITSAGFFGIGTTTPLQELDVNGDAYIRDSTRLTTTPAHSSITGLLTRDATGWVGLASLAGGLSYSGGVLSSSGGTGTARTIPYHNNSGRYAYTTNFRLDTTTTAGALGKYYMKINASTNTLSSADAYNVFETWSGDAVGTGAVFSVADQTVYNTTAGYAARFMLHRYGTSLTAASNLTTGNEIGLYGFGGWVNGAKTNFLGGISGFYTGTGFTLRSDLVGRTATAAGLVNGWKLDSLSRFWVGDGADDYYFTTAAPGSGDKVQVWSTGVPSWVATSSLADGNGIYSGSGTLSQTTTRARIPDNGNLYFGQRFNSNADSAYWYIANYGDGERELAYGITDTASTGSTGATFYSDGAGEMNWELETAGASGTTSVKAQDGTFSVTTSGGNMSLNAGVANEVAVVGLVKAKQEAYNEITSTTSPVTLSNTYSDNLINQGGTQATFTFNFPASPADGQILTLTYNNAISTLTLDGNGETIIGTAVTTAVAGSQRKFKFYSGIGWIKLY